jgi:hypothetical protein
MMRRLAVLVGVSAVFFALVAIALASPTPVVTYTSPIKVSGKPKPGKPAPVTYTGVLDVKNSDGTQPATAPTTTLYFAKELVNNAKYFPSCSLSDIDGKQTVPAKCKAAQIGKGTAASQAGTPGQTSIINEPLTVTAYNGPKGKQFLLVLNASSPVAVQNRVVPATLGPGGGKFGYTLKFTVPANLQSQLGLQIALTHFNVVTSGKTRSVKIKGKKKKVSYLMLKSCPKSGTLPSKAVVNFNTDAGTPGGPTVTNEGTFKCK